MKNKVLILLSAAFIGLYSCKEKPKTDEFTLTPESGTTYKQGEKVNIHLTYAADKKIDSVVYLLDSVRLAAKTDSSALTLATDTMPLGPRLITARIFNGGQVQEYSANITLLTAKAPELYTFKVEKTIPHDTASFTEGLEYNGGIFYESDGGYCEEGEHSSLRKTDANGKILQKIDIDCKVFAEGLTVIDNKIIQLTYHEKVGYVYDKASLKLLSNFQYTQGAEGWGLCNDGKYLYNTSTGTNQIFVMDKNDYHTVREIEVFDDQGPVNNLNELEYIDGLLYANIWQTDNIIVIDPKTGAVLRKIDLTALYPQSERAPHADVLNGIAWDAAGKRMFVTGKKWPLMYQIKIMPKGV
uniref:glutaminyl-peptide cyclotransferase n=1 Tax=Mucilaginibacter sp. Bleaf8 TaxID=2834430 RepID=UPI0020C0B7D7|nr:glutaminyl-peptide cyclotransferase [Mucilaginibacter sp. Bleaf8]